MIGRLPLMPGQAWTPDRLVREKMKKEGSSERDAARVAERVRAGRLGVETTDSEVARMAAAAAKRARRAGREVTTTIVLQGLPTTDFEPGAALDAVLGTTTPANEGAEEPLPVPKLAPPIFIDESEDGAP